MFGPYCATCRRRVLLSTDRIVSFASPGHGRHVAVLRCLCGHLVDWDQRPPDPEATARSEPADASLSRR